MDLYWTCAHAMKWPLWGGHLPDIALRSKTAKNDPAVVCAASKSHPSFAKEQAPALEVSRRRPRPPAHAYNSRRRTFSCLKALGVLLTILVSLLSMSFTQQSRSDAAPPTRQHLEVIRQQGKKYPSDYTADGPPTTDGGENSSVVEATAAPEGAAAGGGAQLYRGQRSKSFSLSTTTLSSSINGSLEEGKRTRGSRPSLRRSAAKCLQCSPSLPRG